MSSSYQRTRKRQKQNRQTLISNARAENDKLDTLIQLEKTQMHSSLPVVRDVPRMILKRNKVHTFSRSLASGTINASTTLDVTGAYSFTLSALPNSSDFTGLFDQYRVIQVTVRFIPLAGVGSGSSPLITVIDYDDASTPASILNLLEYDSVQYTQPGVVLERTLIPKPAVALYSGAFTSFGLGSNQQWIDVASPNVQYYGLKYGIAAATGATANWSVIVDFVMQFRNSR